MSPTSETTLDTLLAFVNERRGFDFTGYKRSSIQRRVEKRMSDVGVDNHEQYIDFLELHPEEFAELFNTILINVTSFFRDPEAWELLATKIVPDLIRPRPPDSPLRVWSAGSASGEEAYTLAMVLARVLGDDAFRDRVKIYATDVDEAALDQARHGAYTPKQIEGVPRDALERFFERTDQRYVFRKDLRRSVIFGRNDLVQDAPISRVDLLVCRNTLMYFTAETQEHILDRFHFALDDDGALMLGKSELLITDSDLFVPIDLKRRVFGKVVRPHKRRLRALPTQAATGSTTVVEILRETAFNLGRAAHVVVDAEGNVVMANESSRRMFGLTVGDLGRPIQDLELSYRPLELRSHLDAVAADLSAIELNAVRWATSQGQERFLNIRLTPLLGDGQLIGTSVSYLDVTDTQELQRQLVSSKRDLEQAYEELQSTVEELETTNEELQSTNEELETTNEELETTNEELQSTNEELETTNEELETMNEELQSTNEELQSTNETLETTNDELRHRSSELDDLNAFLETILTTVGIAVAVLDRSEHIQVWNGQARELWGLTAEEVEGQHLQSLDFGLPVEKLESQLRACTTGASTHELAVVEATNRRGKRFRCQVTCMPLIAPTDGASSTAVNGAIVMMEAVD